MALELKSESLKAQVSKILGKTDFDEIDLQEVDDITFNNRSCFDYDINDLRYFKNLKGLTLIKFQIDDNVIDILNDLKGFKSIQFSRCDFVTDKKLNAKIENIFLNNIGTTVDLNIIDGEQPKLMQIACTSVEKVVLSDLSKYPALLRVELQNCNIENFDELKRVKNLRMLNVDGSGIDDDKLEFFRDRNVFLSNELEMDIDE